MPVCASEIVFVFGKGQSAGPGNGIEYSPGNVMEMNRRLISATVILSLAMLALVGCSREDQPQTSDPPAPKIEGETISFPTNAPQLSAIAVEPAETRKLAVTHVTGRLYWNDERTVRIFTPVGGRVTSVLVDIGQNVTLNEPLAEIDSPDFGQTLAAARTAVGNLVAADKAFTRTKDLFAHGAAASKDVEAAEAAFRAAAAERDRALAQLANFGGTLESTNSIYLLRSKLSGVLVEKNINPGQELRPDMMLGNVPQTYNPIFVVSDPTTLWLQLDVAESDLPELQPGLPLRVTCAAFPGKVFDGTLEKIGAAMDSTTRTVKVRGVVNNPEKLLKAEMYVVVDIVKDTSQGTSAAVEVPARALFLRDNDYYLFVEKAPGQYQREKVRVGVEKDGKVPLFESVKAGQKVVTEGALLLQALVEPSS
jgi:cobalt-zinc-cadmium efflux system membrane fusion protein